MNIKYISHFSSIFILSTLAHAHQGAQDALAALEAKARSEGKQHDPAVRIAHHGGNIYLDPTDGDWRAIEITPYEWSVVSCPTVRFVRP